MLDRNNQQDLGINQTWRMVYNPLPVEEKGHMGIGKIRQKLKLPQWETC